MEFEVYSEESILVARFERPHIIISVADVATYPAEIPPNPLCLSILRLAFYDLLPGEYTSNLMTQAQAHQIWQFVLKYLDKIELIVSQCVYGQGRSAAIAAALSMVLNGHTGDYFTNDNYFPNRHVYNLVLAAGQDV